MNKSQICWIRIKEISRWQELIIISSLILLCYKPGLLRSFVAYFQLREDVKSGVYVENLTEESVCTMKDVTQLLLKVSSLLYF